MKNLKDKVAVITGGASGLGFAMAQRFAQEGVKIVLADIEDGPLQTAVGRLEQAGVDTLGIKCDVSVGEDVEN